MLLFLLLFTVLCAPVHGDFPKRLPNCDLWSGTIYNQQLTWRCGAQAPYFPNPYVPFITAADDPNNKQRFFFNTSSVQFLPQPQGTTLLCYTQEASNAAILLTASYRPAFCREILPDWIHAIEPSAGLCSRRGSAFGYLTYDPNTQMSVFTRSGACSCDADRIGSSAQSSDCVPSLTYELLAPPFPTMTYLDYAQQNIDVVVSLRFPDTCESMGQSMGVRLYQQPNRPVPFCVTQPPILMPEPATDSHSDNPNLPIVMINRGYESVNTDALVLQSQANWYQVVEVYIPDDTGSGYGIYRLQCLYSDTYYVAWQSKMMTLQAVYGNNPTMLNLFISNPSIQTVTTCPFLCFSMWLKQAQSAQSTLAVPPNTLRFAISVVLWATYVNNAFVITPKASRNALFTDYMCKPHWGGPRCSVSCSSACYAVPHAYCDIDRSTSVETCQCAKGYIKLALSQPDSVTGQAFRCQPVSVCPPGYVSPETMCTMRAEACTILGAQINPYTGRCNRCTDSLSMLTLDEIQCTRQHCGNLTSSAPVCNGHGICRSNGKYQYCMCSEGYDGLYCEKNVPTSELVSDPTCDCGVKWSRFLNVINFRFQVVAYTLGPRFKSSTTVTTSSAQADWLCYQDVACDGYLFRPLSSGEQSALQQQQPGHPAKYHIMFFQVVRQVDNPDQQVFTLPTGYQWSVSTINLINRILDYDCPLDRSNPYRTAPMDLLDTAFYAAAYPGQILDFCQQRSNGFLSVQTGDNTLTCLSSNFNYVQQHYQFVGHQQRYRPNARCALSPIPFVAGWSAATAGRQCSQYLPGCMANKDEFQRTCTGHGYCDTNPLYVSNTQTPAQQPYRCSCLPFAVTDVNSKLFGVAQYIGIGCQYDLREYCSPTKSTVICNGFIERCAPIETFDYSLLPGDQLIDFSDSKYSSYKPICRCADSTLNSRFPMIEVAGQFCEQSRCVQDAVHGCRSLGPEAGQCQKDSVTSLWKCACSSLAIGDACQYSTQPCMFNGMPCAGQGQCVLFNASSAGVGTVSCQCTASRFYGPQCQFQACSDDVLVAGHGVCDNGRVLTCYNPYIGPRCEMDICAMSGGTVEPGIPPSRCRCPGPHLAASLYAVNGDITCYPQCPVNTNNNQVCGNSTLHRCTQYQLPGATDIYSLRVAKCECAPGYFLNATTQLCEAWCFHGTVPIGWSPDAPSSCQCGNTGYSTNGGNNPRCDYAICRNGGTWDPVLQQCKCLVPWLNETQCRTSQCDNVQLPGAHPRGYAVSTLDLSYPYQCSCRLPFRPVSYDRPYDCNADLCGAHAVLNPSTALVLDTQGVNQCVCVGRWATRCKPYRDPGCVYCQNTTCLNGGRPNANDPQTCVCSFPFANGAMGNNCEVDQCLTSGRYGDPTALYDSYASQCTCLPGYRGQFCESAICDPEVTLGFDASSSTCVCRPGKTGTGCMESVCKNNGQWDAGQCLCPSPFLGQFCEITPFLLTLPDSANSDTLRNTLQSSSSWSDSATEAIQQPAVYVSVTVATGVMGFAFVFLRHTFTGKQWLARILTRAPVYQRIRIE